MEQEPLWPNDMENELSNDYFNRSHGSFDGMFSSPTHERRLNDSRNNSRGSQGTNRSRNSLLGHDSPQKPRNDDEFDIGNEFNGSVDDSEQKVQKCSETESCGGHNSELYGKFSTQESKAHTHWQSHNFGHNSYYHQQSETGFSGAAEAEPSPWMDQGAVEVSNYSPQHQQKPTFDASRRRTRDNKNHCNCEKTGCLKLYCACYRQGVSCSVRCRCKKCYNTEENQQMIQRQKATNSTFDKNVLQQKLEAEMSESSCSCRQSFCEKSYCACARNEQGCGVRCKCFHCKNPFGRRPSMQSFGPNHGNGNMGTLVSATA